MTHHFNVEMATKHGVAAAVILDNIFYWCHENWLNKRNIIDGKAYTYNSYKAWKELYPYLKERQIGDAIRYLEKERLIESVIPNKMDRTKWYTITAEGIVALSERNFMADDNAAQRQDTTEQHSVQNCKLPDTKTSQCNVQNPTLHHAKTHDASCKNERCNVQKRTMHDTKTRGCLNNTRKPLENALENASVATDAQISEKSFAQRCFESWKNLGLPTGDNTLAEWQRRDFSEGRNLIKQYGYTQEQVLQAINNLGQLKKLMDSGKSWASYTTISFNQFCKHLNKYVPGAFILDSYRLQDKKSAGNLYGIMRQEDKNYDCTF